MALEDIFKALEEQAARDIEQIMEDARSHGDAIVAEAEEQAGAMRSSKVVDAERHARAQSTHGLNAARLEARKRQAGVKETAIQSVFDEALVRLAEARRDPDYRGVFAKLVEEALAGVDGALEVHVDPADEAMAGEALGAMGVNAPVVADLSTAGGVVVVSGEGTVSRRNTFEDRLDKLRSIAQADVAEIVFA